MCVRACVGVCVHVLTLEKQICMCEGGSECVKAIHDNEKDAYRDYNRCRHCFWLYEMSSMHKSKLDYLSPSNDVLDIYWTNTVQ